MRAATKKSPKNATPKKAARSPFTRKAMLECMREILSRGPSEAVWEELKGYASADRETVLSLYKRSVHRRIEWGGFGPLSAVADGGDYPRVTFRAGAKPKGEVVGQVVGPCFALNAHEGDDLVQLVADAAGVKLVDDVPKKVARSAIIEDTNDLITPTPSARRELPPERYQISRKAVVNTIAYHVSCHRALARSSERTNAKHRPRLLAEAQKELAFAENAIMELEALASDHDVDLVLKELKEVYQWEPRDIRPVKMTRTPRQVRAAHTLGQVPNKGRRMASVPLWKPFPDHPGTTIPKDYKDPGFTGISDWSHYPVLQQGNYETHTLQVSARIYAKAKVGLQDGIPVMGYDWLDMSGGGGCAPGRKWGEFPTLKDAEIYAWEHLQGKLDERVRMGSDSAKVKQDLRKLLQKISARLAELQGDAEAAPTATGLQLQLPSTAPLPEGYAKAKDLKPGMVVLPPRRKQAAVVKSVELYGKSCSIMFEGGHAGMNVNPLQPVKLVQVQHVAMAADASPETVAAVREVVAKAYAHKPGNKPRTPKRKIGHQAGDVLPDGTLVVDPTNAILELHDAANGVHVQFTQPVPLDQLSASFVVPVDAAQNAKLRLNVATPPATAPTPEQSAPYAHVHVVSIMERHKNAECGAGETWAAFDARCKALLSEAVASLDELYSNGYKSSARAIHKHVLDLYGEWLPTRFAPQAPTPEKSAPPAGQLMERKPGQPWKPVTTTAHTLSELAAPFGADRREREVVKKRFRSMYGKLSTWPADQRRAFIQYITNTLDQ